MKNSKKLLLSIIAVTILIFAPCHTYAEPENTTTPTPSETESPNPSPSPSEKPETPSEQTIKLDKTEITLDSEKMENLKATITPSNTESEIEWTSSNEKIVTVKNGVVTAGTTAGEATITATIKGTNIKATCTVKVTRTISKDATLKKLVISNGTLDKDFEPNTLEYSVSVDSNTSSLSIKYETSDSNVSFSGITNNENLKNGSVVEIKIIAEDEKTNKTYKLKIVKDANTLELKELKINGYALNESFKADLLEYTASIPYEVDTITVVATAKDSAAKIKTEGLTNLKVGKNKVTITVSDKSGNSKKYSIIVTRESKTSIEENPTSIITSSNHSTSSSSTSSLINKNSNDDSLLKYVIVSIACFILFVIGGIGIYFYLQTSPKKLKKEIKTSKNKEETSPILEVKEEKQTNLTQNIQENIENTKEYDIKKEQKIITLDELFDDKKDV